jgi:hypothetical protein
MNSRRRSPSQFTDEAIDALGTALFAVDIDLVGSRPGPPFDATVDVAVDGQPFAIALARKAYCTGQTVRQLLDQADRSGGRGLHLLVADRMTAEARDLLTDAGWSWLDRRGQLHLHWPTVRVDREVAPSVPLVRNSSAELAIRGRSGVTVAYWLLAHPDRSLSPTGHRSELALAPSSISTAVRRLSAAGLLDDNGHALVPELFWELANVWRPDHAWLAGTPMAADHSKPDHDGTAWRRSGSAAAAAWGAPIVTTGGGPVELYVAGPVELSIARRRHGAAGPGTGAAVLAVAPTGLVLADTGVDRDIPTVDGWMVAPKLAIALDLARDRGRGREILAEWNDRDALWR